MEWELQKCTEKVMFGVLRHAFVLMLFVVSVSMLVRHLSRCFFFSLLASFLIKRQQVTSVRRCDVECTTLVSTHMYTYICLSNSLTHSPAFQPPTDFSMNKSEFRAALLGIPCLVMTYIHTALIPGHHARTHASHVHIPASVYSISSLPSYLASNPPIISPSSPASSAYPRTITLP